MLLAYTDTGTGSQLALVVFVAFWLLPSFLIARWAAKKGHSFTLILILGVLLSPVISLVVTVWLSDRRAPG